MPHLVIYYTPNLEAETDVSQLCRDLADAMITCRDEHDAAVFPKGGVRVLAYPATHFAIADGSREFAFVYLNLRIGRGRSATVHTAVGEKLTAVTHQFFANIFAERAQSGRNIGITFQVDEGQEVFDNKLSNIHPLFQSADKPN